MALVFCQAIRIHSYKPVRIVVDDDGDSVEKSLQGRLAGWLVSKWTEGCEGEKAEAVTIHTTDLAKTMDGSVPIIIVVPDADSH